MADIPLLTPLPAPPVPTDAEDVFDAHAGASLTAQVTFAAEMNANVIPGINLAVSASTAAAQTAISQATIATNSSGISAAAAITATAAAAAAGAVINLAPYGNPGDSLQVNAARNGLVFGPNDGQVGDVKLSSVNPGPLWISANGAIRSQTSMPTLFAALGLLGAAFGTVWAGVTTGITGAPVDIISNPNSGVVIAILAAGNAMRSTDRGATWSPLTIGTTGLVFSCIGSNNDGYWLAVVGSTGALWGSADDGATWAFRQNLPSAPYGRISADGNGQWLCSPSGSSTSIQAVRYGSMVTFQVGNTFATGAAGVHGPAVSDGQGVWHVLVGAQVRRSTDGGLTWAVQFTGSAALAGISTDKNGVWLAAGTTSNTYTYKSLDNGLTWALAPLPTGGAQNVTDISYANGFFFLVRNISPQVIAISSSPDTTLYNYPATGVLASANKITHSGLNTLNVMNTVNANTLRSIPTYGYDSASQFKLPNFTVADGLKAWIKAALIAYSKGVTFSQLSVSAIPAVTMATDGGSVIIGVTAVGGVVTISRSADGGVTWNAQTVAGVATPGSITTNNSGLWLIGCGVGIILRSVDNGLTWSTISAATTGFSVQVTDLTFGFGGVVVGGTSNTAVPRRSTDGGLTWGVIATLPSAAFKFATDGNNNWLAYGATSNLAYISTNNGASFGSAITTGGSGTLSDIKMFKNGTVLTTSNSAAGRRSTNYGATWSALTGGGVVSALAIGVPLGFVAAATKNDIYASYSTDYGATWSSSIIPATSSGSFGIVATGANYLLMDSAGKVFTAIKDYFV